MAEGKADTLKRLLQRRFGSVPQAVQSRISQASNAEAAILIHGRMTDAPIKDALMHLVAVKSESIPFHTFEEHFTGEMPQ